MLTYPDIKKPIVDKHATGGIGEKTSLVLSPLFVECGLVNPMISGRGLGHTGGTLDKLQSIPGFDIFLNEEKVEQALKGQGAVLIG